MKMQPKTTLRWRMADMAGTGIEQVNVVMPETNINSPHEILLATDIPSPQASALDIGWTAEDVNLFTLLLDKMLGFPEGAGDLEIDDPEIIDILHVVAAAHFIPPASAQGILAADINTVLSELDVADLVAINTQDGFKSAIICGLDSIEALCVLLEPIEGIEGQHDLDIYDTILVNKHSILPAEFGNVVPDDECLLN